MGWPWRLSEMVLVGCHTYSSGQTTCDHEFWSLWAYLAWRKDSILPFINILIPASERRAWVQLGLQPEFPRTYTCPPDDLWFGVNSLGGPKMLPSASLDQPGRSPPGLRCPGSFGCPWDFQLGSTHVPEFKPHQGWGPGQNGLGSASQREKSRKQPGSLLCHKAGRYRILTGADPGRGGNGRTQ